MRVHVSPETFRRLTIAGEEHGLDPDRQATLAVAAAFAAWRQGVRSTVPDATAAGLDALSAELGGGAVVQVSMLKAVADDLAALAHSRRMPAELQVALALRASVAGFDPPPPKPPARWTPRQWRVREDVAAAIEASSASRSLAGARSSPLGGGASLTAALMGDPSFGTSVTAARGGLTRGEELA